MKQTAAIFRCSICGQTVEVLHAGAGELVCCDQPMELVTVNTADAAREKHVPVIIPENSSTLVKIGSQPHPMDQAHFIEWIELFEPGLRIRMDLHPGEAPEALFPVPYHNGMNARTWCNLHGLWQKP